MDGFPNDGELPESRLYTFIDAGSDFALYFLEGQKLIYDLALKHGVRGAGFAYFRDVLLSVQPMIALTKRGEQLGFYVDSSDPYFRLKIETSHHGDTRCALVPELFADFPETLAGSVRLLKLFPNDRPPYQSVLRIDGLPLGEVVNRVLENSYQVACTVVLAAHADQSAMVHRLPPLPRRLVEPDAQRLLEERRVSLAAELTGVFDRALTDPEAIAAAFAGLGFHPLAVRGVRFACSCSRERAIRNIRLIRNASPSELFEPDRETIDVVCEYCKTHYEISRADLRMDMDYRH